MGFVRVDTPDVDPPVCCLPWTVGWSKSRPYHVRYTFGTHAVEMDHERVEDLIDATVKLLGEAEEAASGK